MCTSQRPLNGADASPMEGVSAQWAYASLVNFLEFIDGLPDQVQLKMIRGYVGRLADPEKARDMRRLS